ncbi:zinc ribbon domain-containing protein, partial [bacterium]|nr:zinc ribbon domain-containing protein [bacterium]
MPVYEFLCGDCNRVFNFLARTAGAAKREPRCPKCGGGRMGKLFSRFATRSGARKQSTPDHGVG